MDLRLRTPFRMAVCGPSGSGKTSLILELISFRELMCVSPPRAVFYFYTQWNDEFNKVSNVHFIKGVPTPSTFENYVKVYKDIGGSLVIIDDAMGNIKSSDFSAIFTKYSHHLNASVCILLQSLFAKENVYRIISLNCNYFILTKNPRDSAQFGYFIRQLSTSKKQNKFYQDVFSYVTKRPFGYIFLDLSQNCNEKLRVRTNYIPRKNVPMSVFLPILD